MSFLKNNWTTTVIFLFIKTQNTNKYLFLTLSIEAESQDIKFLFQWNYFYELLNSIMPDFVNGRHFVF